MWRPSAQTGRPQCATADWQLEPPPARASRASRHDHLLEASLAPPGGSGAPDYPPHELCVEIEIELGAGDADATVVGSDLTQEYVSINADYRS